MEIVKEQPEWFRKALEVKHKSDFAEISGAKVHFMEWGSPLNPSVIMLHGNHAHAHWFQFIGGLLVDKYHFVVMSFSGMGESEWRSSYDKDSFIADVLGVVKATNLVRPVIVGHSFGGMVALATADKYSEDMSGLILVDFVVRRPENHIDWYKNLPPSKAPKIRPSKEELVKRFRLMPPQECKNQFLLDFIAERSVRKTDQGWSWTFDPSTYDHLDVGNNQSEVLNQLNCPVSFMYGENTMEFDTGNSIKEMKELLPKGSSVVALKEAQHHLMLDKPLEFVEELDKLIQEFVQ